MTNEEVEEDDYTVPAVVRTVLERDEHPDRAGVGRSILSVINRIEQGGWPVRGLSTTLVHVSDEFRKEDSKKKPGQEAPEHRKGELVKAAHEERFWWVQGAFPVLQMAFQAGWKEGVTPKGGRSFGFISAHCADPIGIPTEFFADYSLGANDLKQKKDEPEWAHHDRADRLQRLAIERDRMYNDGHSWLNRQPMFSAYKEFDAWFAEALDMTARITSLKEAA